VCMLDKKVMSSSRISRLATATTIAPAPGTR
jgi:hypothetical protein